APRFAELWRAGLRISPQGESRSPGRNEIGAHIEDAGSAATTSPIDQTSSYSKACAACYRADITLGGNSGFENPAKRDVCRIVSIESGIQAFTHGGNTEALGRECAYGCFGAALHRRRCRCLGGACPSAESTYL